MNKGDSIAILLSNHRILLECTHVFSQAATGFALPPHIPL
jgi:hypothetical protein